jgi:hypothetical protein
MVVVEMVVVVLAQAVTDTEAVPALAHLFIASRTAQKGSWRVSERWIGPTKMLQQPGGKC